MWLGDERTLGLYRLRRSDGFILETTKQHRAWTKARGLVSIEHLSTGDELLSTTGNVTVTSVAPVAWATVRELDVDDEHEMFANGVLVSDR